MDVLQPALQYGGSFGAGLMVGLAVALIVWRQLVRQQNDASTRSEAIAIAMTSIDKTLGFLIDTVKDSNIRRRGR
jgi:hypothetical protein